MNLEILFSDFEKEFILVDYFPTHSQLLYRNHSAKSEKANIDIVFKQIRMLYIPDKIEGLELTVVRNEPAILDLQTQFNFIVDYGYKIYKLSDRSGFKYFINAGAAGIFKNDFSLLQSSLGDLLTSEVNECILWHSQ